MPDLDCNCSKFLKSLDGLIQIGIFVCICILCSLSSKDPFKSHRIGNITSYFNGNYNFNTTNLIDIECQCGEETMNRTCSEEEIIQGCKMISFENIKIRKNLRRKLASSSFCGDMYDSFVRNKGRKISFVFDLNYGTIRGLSIATMIVTICYFVICVIVACNIKKIEEWKANAYDSHYYYFRNTDRCKFFLPAFFVLLLWIAKIVLGLLLFYYVENGDIEKYDDFLDCGLVKKKYFSKFSDVSKLRKCFLAFGVFNLISEILGKIEQLFDPPDDS